MSHKSRPATQAQIIDVKRLLVSARNRYENKILEIEKIWAGLKPRDYEKRKLITVLTYDLLEIDKSLKIWEDKLK